MNPKLDRTALAAEFARNQRVQIREVLDREAADRLIRLLVENTPWGLTWQIASDGPHKLRSSDLPSLQPARMQAVSNSLHHGMAGTDFAFIHSQYQASDALKHGWSTSRDHDALVLDLNGYEFLDFIRDVTGVTEIACCDAQATHFGPGQFLSVHEDVNAGEADHRLVAYVLSLCIEPWRPDWGGYLNFFDGDGDVIHGYRPRFNSLNMFTVPRLHNVSLVAPFAAGSRLAITGWFRSA